MTTKRVSLVDELSAYGPGVVSLAGGGGKTTLLFLLGAGLAARGDRVLCTTTTRMGRPDDASAIPFLGTDEPENIVLPPGGVLLAAQEAGPDGDPEKIYGYDASRIDALIPRGVARWVLVEADGSARKPLKAPAGHEPVIPATTRVVVAVAGLSGIGLPLGPESVFRPERFAAATGLSPGRPVSPEAVAAIACHPRGLFQNSPPEAARLLFCNQADLPGAEAAGKAVAAAARRDHPGQLQGIYVGSLRSDGLSCLSLPTK